MHVHMNVTMHGHMNIKLVADSSASSTGHMNMRAVSSFQLLGNSHTTAQNTTVDTCTVFRCIL